MTNLTRVALWEQYPEVREMFEEYNDILLEDDPSWERLTNRFHEILDSHNGDKYAEAILLDAVDQLEKMAKKRRYG